MSNIERQRRIARLASELRQDFWFALRLLRRSPGFSAVAVLTLAVAIGGNAAIFSLVNAIALKPLPAEAPQEIVRVYSGQSQTSWLNYQDIRDRNRVFTEVAAHAVSMAALSAGDSTVRSMGESVSTNYFTMLGIPAAIGRTFLPSDTRTDLVVLNDRTWRGRFTSDPSIAGRTIVLGGRNYEVLGVMPKNFRGARPPGFASEFWTPVDASSSSRTLQDRLKPAYEIVARVKPGISVEQAQAAMLVLAEQIRTEHPQLEPSFTRTEVFPIEGIGGFRGFTGTLAPLFAFVGLMTVVAGLVLLVGCANIAGLLLGRGAARRREIGVRLALGAGRGRLIRQLLTESLLLALIGGSAGILLAVWLGSVLTSQVSRLPVPVELDLALDRRMLTYTLLASLATSLLCGLAPARRATRVDVIPALKEDESKPKRQRIRQVLVVAQVAISCLLLMWGGLFLRSLTNAHRVHPGFDPSGVLVASVELDENMAAPGAIGPALAGLQSRLRAIPGVQAEAISTVVPLTLTGREEYRVRTESDSREERGRWVMANRVSPNWFETLRIPIVAGRDFTTNDRAGAPPVVIVNETLARQFWNGDALGRRLDSSEVIGIVRDSKYWTLGETVLPTVYTPFAQRPVSQIHVLVRSANPAALAKALRAEFARLDGHAFVDIRPMPEAVGAALLPAQVGAAFTSGFGAVGALLMMLGIYGLVSFTVSQRTREIGIRKAIGARARDIVGLVVRDSVIPVALGLTAGLLVGALGALGLGGFIFGVSPIDPITIGATATLVLGTAVAASALPALRASRVDPLVTLKVE